MKWVTRRGVRLDRTACTWLIRRYIDPQAEISYVEAEAIPTAVQGGALPFHNTTSEDADMERTSFDQLLAEYKLDQQDSALTWLSAILRGAELHEADAPAEAAGLEAIAQGINALSHSDDEMVTLAMPLFDALYAYCKRKAEGRSGWANQEERVGKLYQLAQAML